MPSPTKCGAIRLAKESTFIRMCPITTRLGNLLSKEGRTDIKSLDDLKGKKVALTANSEFRDLINDLNKKNGNAIEAIYSDKGSAENLNLVATGRADAAGEYEYIVAAARKDKNLPCCFCWPRLPVCSDLFHVP